MLSPSLPRHGLFEKMFGGLEGTGGAAGSDGAAGAAGGTD